MSIVQEEGKRANTEALVRARSSSLKSATVLVIEPEQIAQFEESWTQLAHATVAPNVYYEPWMLLPAIKHLRQKVNIHFLLVFGPKSKDGTEQLWGFFPIEIQWKCLNLPVRTLAFWQHRYCFLAAPLIDRGHVWEVLDAFWRWFEKNPFHCRILDTNYLPSDGPFHTVWADFAIGRSALVLNDYPRAILEPSGTAKSYVSNLISKKHQHEYTRQERRLSEFGRVAYNQVNSPTDVDKWTDDFLQLEASGWKGAPNGGAFAKHDVDSEYFRAITREGFTRNRVMLLSLSLDGKPIAMKYNLLTEHAGFAFKIAHDENYYKYSPGTLLELENIRRVCDHPQIRWMDSCASPRHPLANRIWSERRMIRRTLFSNGSCIGDFWTSAIPLFRWIRNQVKTPESPSYFQISTKLGIREE